MNETTVIALEVCQVGNNTTSRTASDNWKALIHEGVRVVLRKATYNKLHNTNIFGANHPAAPAADPNANNNQDLISAVSAGMASSSLITS